MGPESAQEIARQHDVRVFHEGEVIFNEDDLRELINYIYSEYQFKGTQSAKLVRLIDFLASGSNKFLTPELAGQIENLSTYLNNFWDFLKNNFQEGKPTEEGETVFYLKIQETGFETESFLIEFQMQSLDVEKAYRNYRAAVASQL